MIRTCCLVHFGEDVIACAGCLLTLAGLILLHAVMPGGLPIPMEAA